MQTGSPAVGYLVRTRQSPAEKIWFLLVLRTCKTLQVQFKTILGVSKQLKSFRSRKQLKRFHWSMIMQQNHLHLYLKVNGV